MSNKTVKIIFKGQDDISDVTRQVRDNIRDLGQASEKTNTQSGGFFTNLAANAANVKAAWDMLAGVGQALGSVVSGAMDYQDAISLIGAGSDEAAGRLGEFRERAKELGADLTLPGTSAGDAAEAMLELSKAGLNVNDTLKASKGVLQLSAAGQLSNAKSAEIAANALNAFGLKGERATAVADLLAATANASSSEVADLADGMSMAAAVFSSLQGPVVGSEEALIDLNTAMGILANNGIKGSDAGTSLKQSLLALAAPSDKALGLMEDLAASIGESGNLAYDAAGNMRPYQEMLDILARSTADMTQAERDYTIATIFGADATRSILALLKDGPAGWNDMEQSVTKAGAAGELANARMQGLRGAIEGFASTIQTRALAAIEPFLPLMERAVTAGAQWVDQLLTGLQPALDGLAAGLGFLVDNGDILGPLLMGLTAATVAYATANLVSAIPSGVALAAAILKVTAAVKANLIAFAPYAAVALAVAGVAYAYNDLQKKARNATDELLSQRTWWTEGARALDAYSGASEEVQNRLQGTADGLRALQDLQRSEIEAQMKSGMGPSQEQLDRWNARAAAIQQNTLALDAAMAAATRTELVEQGLLSNAADHALAEEARAGAIRLTADELEKLAEQLQETAAEGTTALASVVASDVGFLTQLEDGRASHVARIKELEAERAKATTDAERQAIDERLKIEQAGFAEQQKQQALAYAEQQAAQLAHLGRMLIDFATAQAKLHGVGAKEMAELTGDIAREYGIHQSLSERAFGEMADDIEAWAISGGKDADHLMEKLDDTRDSTVDMQIKMDALAKEYTATLIQNFDEGKIDAGELMDQLTKIPAKVYSEVVITETTRRRVIDVDSAGNGKPRPAGAPLEARAMGGPVLSGTPYLVGEEGPELFVPRMSGTVVSNPQTTAMLAGGGGQQVNLTIQNPTVDSADRLQQLVDQTQRAIMQALNGEVADLIAQGAT